MSLRPVFWSERIRDDEVKYPKWQPEFHEALLETNRGKLLEKIHGFETAVFVRLQELALSSDHRDERIAIRDATAAIAVLKKTSTSLEIDKWSGKHE